ncbi:MAG: DNA translocase FtsK 4TM domain-containing protein [Lachnospiraceae bacterium]|nr:DNA translocase FtsK 4TM domain-containing protein [Lachnospiraceae bacterium]
MANTKKDSSKKSASSSSKKYPNSKFNNKAIENVEKNSVNVNVALDRKNSPNATDDYLEEMRKRKEIVDDIVIICTILVAILLELSLFDLCGVIGGFFKNVMMGMMGKVVSYIFPFALVAFVFFTRSNKGNPVATRKSIYFWTMAALVCGLINLAGNYADHFEFVASFKAKQGGGLIGELLSCPLHALFGNLGAILIFVTLILVCLILLSGKAIIHIVRKKRAEKKAMMREIEEQEREEEERRRAAAAVRRPQDTNYQEYRQLTLDEIQEENRKKRLVFVDVEQNVQPGTSGIDIYEPPKPKKKLSIIDRLKGYGKNDPENPKPRKKSQQVDITHYQPIITQTTPVAPAYQTEMDRKFGAQNAAKPQGSNEVLNSNYSYDDDGSGIPTIYNRPNNTAPQFDIPEPEPVKPYVPPANDDTYPNVSATAAASTAPNFAETSVNKTEPKSEPAPQKPAKAEAGTEDSDIGPIDEVSTKPYVFPSIDLLKRPAGNQAGMSGRELQETAAKLERTLHSFGVNVTVTNFTSGPNVTRYELQPEEGTRVNRITALSDDIKLNLAAADIRIEAPIPGKNAVGIEVPNTKGSTVYFRSLIESDAYKNSKGKITFAVGKDIAGETIVTDIAKMPHCLIAGATGSGKSVCINTIIMSVLYKYEPKDVRLIMIDPKVVELSVYNGIPHLLIPVVTEAKKAYGALNWGVQEMMDRYKRFAELEVRDIEAYNEKIRHSRTPLLDNEGNVRAELPQILIIVDEMADLMMVSPGEVEEAICRLAQLARAAGIHLVLATQRPTVNVITGLIKANVPSRIAFAVASATDSRTILDQVGADKLLGKGDMLFFPSGIPKPIRVQGAFISDDEVKAVVNDIKTKNNGAVSYSERISEQIDKASAETGKKNGGSSLADTSSSESDHDEYFAEAGRFIIEKDKASIGLLQRMYKIGFNRAARIMDQLAEAGVVGPEEGTKPRTILMSKEQFENYLEQNGG